MVENPVGSVRRGKDKGGKAWETTMKADYGYLEGYKGADKDHLDVFVKPGEQEYQDEYVYVIDQVNPETGEFDEHKVMFGYHSIEDAKAGYLANYEPGWKGLEGITEMDWDQFDEWVSEPKNLKHSAELEKTQYKTGAVQESNLLLAKEKKYVKTASEVPEGYTIRQGPKGGLYYESEERAGSQPFQPQTPEQPQAPPQIPGMPPMQPQNPEYLWKGADRDRLTFMREKVKNLGAVDVDRSDIYGVFKEYNDKKVKVDKYEVAGKAIFYVNHDDPPDNLLYTMEDVASVVKTYPGERIPKVVILGKDVKPEFDWVNREGEARHGKYGGVAHLSDGVIALHDNYVMQTHITAHEVGHIAQSDLMFRYYNEGAIFAKHDCPSLKYLSGIAELEDYNDFVDLIEQIKPEGTPMDEFVSKNIEISNIIRLAREKGIEIIGTKFRPENNLERTYDFVETLYQRVISMGFRAKIEDAELERGRKAMTERKATAKMGALGKEWHQIYEDEPWPDNEYANQNDSEMFADYYAEAYETLNYLEEHKKNFEEHQGNPVIRDTIEQMLEHLKKHPKKYKFFSKNVFPQFKTFERLGRPKKEEKTPEQAAAAAVTGGEQ